MVAKQMRYKGMKLAKDILLLQNGSHINKFVDILKVCLWRKKYSEAIMETAQTWWGCRWRRSAKYNQCHCCIRTFRSCINCYNWSTGIRRLIILYFEKWLGYNDVIAEVCETHFWPNCMKCKSGYTMLNVWRVGGQALK